MQDELSILLIVILAIGGATLMTLLLSCYACIFRDLCCKQNEQLKRRANMQRSIRGNKQNLSDAIAMNDLTQGESMATESEKV
ncbi:uncharacterized protein LOC122511302 [Leptopilina heterotoma]|uniref:uncharacterized protein LOC122511302 n=1 Tax=Leptopilina heterotoma TaxID=63436 RepID=UPI001CA7FF78|nr:uncharacterized protein LOC122511302 [Leptopilina heterotoma]